MRAELGSAFLHLPSEAEQVERLLVPGGGPSDYVHSELTGFTTPSQSAVSLDRFLQPREKHIGDIAVISGVGDRHHSVALRQGPQPAVEVAMERCRDALNGTLHLATLRPFTLRTANPGFEFLDFRIAKSFHSRPEFLSGTEDLWWGGGGGGRGGGVRHGNVAGRDRRRGGGA